MQQYLLAGDVGGTKTVLALYRTEGEPREPEHVERMPSASFDSFNELVSAFLNQHSADIVMATIGVAGPVVDGVAQITNLPWCVRAVELEKTLEAEKVTLLNDLQAIAHSVPALGDDDFHTLQKGSVDTDGAIGVIAPGTGLGEAFLVHEGNHYEAFPSEGGHCSFSPVDDLQQELLTFMRGRFGHVSFERVCSGSGFPNLYAFLRDARGMEEPDWLARELNAADDMTPVIVKAAMDEQRQALIAVAALDLFVNILGTACGNLALKLFATGGIYIGGGIAPRILERLQQADLLQAFTSKGRFTDFVKRIPLKVILNSRSALWGAAAHAFQTYTEEQDKH